MRPITRATSRRASPKTFAIAAWRVLECCLRQSQAARSTPDAGLHLATVTSRATPSADRAQSRQDSCGTRRAMTRRSGRREWSVSLLAYLALDPGQHRRYAAQPQRADQVLQPELAGELGWRLQDLVRAQAVQPGVQDACEAAGGRCLPRRVKEEVNDAVVVNLDRHEQRCLALRYLLQQVLVPGVPGGQRRQLLGELQQQLQPFFVRDRAEVPGDLLQPGIEGARAGGHGFSPRRMGARTEFPHSVHDPS